MAENKRAVTYNRPKKYNKLNSIKKDRVNVSIAPNDRNKIKKHFGGISKFIAIKASELI
jgi:hypothetical protein